MKTTKTVLFLALGVLFWFNAAMIIRFFGDSVFSAHNPRLIWFYGLAIPITLLSMYLTSWITRLAMNELMKPVVLMTLMATFLDAIALTWFRGLYSNSYEVALHGAAWILWGAGLGLLFSYYLETKAKR